MKIGTYLNNFAATTLHSAAAKILALLVRESKNLSLADTLTYNNSVYREFESQRENVNNSHQSQNNFQANEPTNIISLVGSDFFGSHYLAPLVFVVVGFCTTPFSVVVREIRQEKSECSIRYGFGFATL